MGTANIRIVGRTREELLVIAERACSALISIANQVQTDEGDKEETEGEIGLPISEIIEMAHDNMIGSARATLESIEKDFPATPAGG